MMATTTAVSVGMAFLRRILPEQKMSTAFEDRFDPDQSTAQGLCIAATLVANSRCHAIAAAMKKQWLPTSKSGLKPSHQSSLI
jgi:hypothetical protein